MTDDTIIRSAVAGDLAAILSVEAACQSVTWSSESFQQELSDENTLGCVAQAANGTVCGYVLARCAADECMVHTIAVLPFFRRRSIGVLLMKELMARAVLRRIATLFLEVRGKNMGAQAFYTALGFTSCGARKAYYRDDDDDAIIMVRPLDLSA
jgi:ribosomal-protein-alanine N-acetyltransferase